MAERICNEYNTSVINVLTGFKYIGEQIGYLEKSGQVDRFLLGFEESCGYLIGTQVRDKDSLVAGLMICKIAAEAKTNGLDLYDLIQSIYDQYGKITNCLLTYEFAGASGKKDIDYIMSRFRKNGIKKILNKKVVKYVDYLYNNESELPKSDVLYFDLGNHETVIIRPSGTEPILKIYLSLQKDMEGVKKYFDNMFNSAM